MVALAGCGVDRTRAAPGVNDGDELDDEPTTSDDAAPTGSSTRSSTGDGVELCECEAPVVHERP